MANRLFKRTRKQAEQHDDATEPAATLDAGEKADGFVDETEHRPELDPNAIPGSGPQRDPGARPVDEDVDTGVNPSTISPEASELDGLDVAARATGLSRLGIHKSPFGTANAEDPTGVESRRGSTGDGQPTRGRGVYGGPTGEDVDGERGSGGRGFTTKFEAQSEGLTTTRTDRPIPHGREWKTTTKDSDGKVVDAHTISVTRDGDNTVLTDYDELTGNTGTTITDGNGNTQTTVRDENGNRVDGDDSDDDDLLQPLVPEKKKDDSPAKADGGTTSPEKRPVDPVFDDPAPSIYDPLTGEIPIEVQRELDVKLGRSTSSDDEPWFGTAEGDGRGTRVRFPVQGDEPGTKAPPLDPTLVNPGDPDGVLGLRAEEGGSVQVTNRDLVVDPGRGSEGNRQAETGASPPPSAPAAPPPPPIGSGEAAPKADFAPPAPAEEPDAPPDEATASEPGWNDDAI